MFIRLTSASLGTPAWVVVGYVQAVIGNPRGGSRVKMMDGWVEVSEEPDDVIRLIEQTQGDL
jgi:hypothetical protein